MNDEHQDDFSERGEGCLGPEGCLFPDNCCMPGPHYTSECHTPEMLQSNEDSAREDRHVWGGKCANCNPPAASQKSDCDEDEELIQQCIEVIRSEQRASASLLQRRLRLGYTRAARIMDELEIRKIVGPSKGPEPRDILID